MKPAFLGQNKNTHPHLSDSRQSTCIRCGTCCKKDGPAFHHEDKHLIEKGTLLSKHLYTIREGEPVYENVKGCIVTAPSDIIKIKSKDHSRACMFLDEKTLRCSIYESRPKECRVLQCWDTRKLEKMYAKNRLTRKDLLQDINDLWELVSDHQRRCDYREIQRLLSFSDSKSGEYGPAQVCEMVRYDTHFRKLLAEKGGMDPDPMDFLFGRPLAETIQRFGIKRFIESNI